MAVIQYVKRQEKSTLLLLGISEGEDSARYTVSAALYESLGSPDRGESLSEGEMAEIIYADEEYRAKKKALSLLALADNNEYNLRQKLLRYGIRREIAEAVVGEMVGRGYVDEIRQLERLVLREANEALHGKRKILARLVAKGYSPSDVKSVILKLSELGEVDFIRNRERLIEHRLGDGADEEEVKKLLYKHGY